MRALWALVKIPVLLIRGAESDLLLRETAAEMAAQPHVHLAEIAGAGHAPALMDPAQVALVADFLAQ
jgi:pimeloyl-ACP methyl ester carboxylesterase